MPSIKLARGVSVPEAELELRAARSSGPGGQSVNTTDSKVELRWSITDSAALTAAQRSRLLDRLASRLTKDGVLILQGSEHKSQHRNRDAVIARFRAIVGEALEPPKQRRKTRPSRSAKRRRLEAKKRRSETKQLRKPPST
ncbi:MAG: aminoacyl-tRNA hydrolase [Nitriliruptoraceae bacterium]|nr:aminoacyl-tRNA hydrolase [Nitriliruptoraceae bacterium]